MNFSFGDCTHDSDLFLVEIMCDGIFYRQQKVNLKKKKNSEFRRLI